jgi:hypothetical protein
MVEFFIVIVFVAIVGYFVYYMLNKKEAIGLLDLNKDGEVNKADAEVVVEKAKKNVKKAVTTAKDKATTAVKSRAKSNTTK